ncbi:uncharacterized protein LOC118180098 [Stegodyphus dumicola]|uniref:uncharacterized protein LOC118180098 n=1 Tax=Stegodyphus dumicola TaxID=202533 RepID=UPI0015AEDDF2|nr:uncharacterized protein LOC118180098 [Stegodyphus dumicola]
MRESLWKREFRLLLKRSVITGIPELLATRNNLRRFLRFCVFLICICGFFYTTSIFLRVYWKYPTVMNVNVEYPETVEIPAFTFCSYNGIQASNFCARFPDLCSPQKNYTEFCKMYFYFCDRNYIYDNNMTLPAVSTYELPDLDRIEYKELGNKVEDLLELCEIRYTSGHAPCLNETRWISAFDTMGLPNNCYAVNSLIGNVHESPKTMASKSKVILKIKTATRDAFYTSTPGAIQISVHSPRVIVNPFKTGFAIKPCYNYFVYISKIRNLLLPFPYATNCTDYHRLWEERGGHGPLTKTQCREECLYNASVEDAHCVDPFFITYPNVAPICKHPVGGRKYTEKCESFCSRACEREDIYTDVEEHASLSVRNSRYELEECTSTITFAFNRMELKTYIYSPKYQAIELFGYIGGYLGVFLGISLLAITDVLESFYVIFKICKRALQGNKRKIRKYKNANESIKKYERCYHDNYKKNAILKLY